jgi:hypothetical protein
MPAKAPCAEVAEEVAATAKLVRVGKLMLELAAATKPPPAPPAANPAVATAGTGAAKVPQPRNTTVVAKSTTPQPRAKGLAANSATSPSHASAVAAKPATPPSHANTVVAKINERAPTAPQPKVHPKPARAATLIERVFGSGKTAAAPARKPVVAQAASKPTPVRKEANNDRKRAAALESLAAR